MYYESWNMVTVKVGKGCIKVVSKFISGIVMPHK